MRTADSSVLVAALATWHENHEMALIAVERLDCLIAHTIAETFAVLTAMQPPYRSPVPRVREALCDLRARHAPLDQPVEAYEEAMEVVQRSGRSGGAVYDALIARIAARAGAALVTLDGRARSVYLAADVHIESLD